MLGQKIKTVHQPRGLVSKNVHPTPLKMSTTKNKQGIPVITVDLDEPASTRWIKPGRKIARLANELTDSMVELCATYLPTSIRPLLNKPSLLLSLLAKLPCQALLGDLMEEAKGLSKGTGIPAPLLALANCTYDATQYMNGTSPTACSAAVYHNKSGAPSMIRYMDWAVPKGIGRYTVQVDYVRDGVHAYSSLGFAGFLGVITAMSPSWALAFNQAPAARVRKSILGSPATYAARQACDASETFQDLKQEISTVRAFTPFLALLCGDKKGQVARIERPMHGRATVAKPNDGRPLPLTNHYIHRSHRKFNSEFEWEDEDGKAWFNDTQDRLCTVEEIAHGCRKKDHLPAFRELKRLPVYYYNTVHLAALCPASGEFKYTVKK